MFNDYLQKLISLVHGEEPRQRRDGVEPTMDPKGLSADQEQTQNDDGFDDLGLGEVRTIPARDNDTICKEPSRIIIFVKAHEDEPIDGKQLFHKIMSSHYKANSQCMYEYSSNVSHTSQKPLFKLANLTEDGEFDFNQVAFKRYKGVVFIMDLPGPQNASRAFSIMLKHIEDFAQCFHAYVMDENMEVLTVSKLQSLKEQAAKY